MSLVQIGDKYEFLFNGIAIPCYNDTDCPGAGICAVNQTWTAQPGGWCMCNTLHGFEGDECRTLGPRGVFILICYVLNCFVALGLVIFAVYNGYHYVRNGEPLKHPVFVTLCFAGTGCLCFLVFSVLGAFTSAGFRDLVNSNRTNDPLDLIIRRIQKASLALIVEALVLAFFLYFCLPGFAQSVVSDPTSSVTSYQVMFRLSVLLWLALFGTAIWFISPMLLRTIRARVASNRRRNTDMRLSGKQQLRSRKSSKRLSSLKQQQPPPSSLSSSLPQQKPRTDTPTPDPSSGTALSGQAQSSLASLPSNSTIQGGSSKALALQ